MKARTHETPRDDLGVVAGRVITRKSCGAPCEDKTKSTLTSDPDLENEGPLMGGGVPMSCVNFKKWQCCVSL